MNITIHFFSPNLPSSSWAAVAFTIAKACTVTSGLPIMCAITSECSTSVAQGSCRELWQIKAFPARLGIADIKAGQTETSNLGDAFISSEFQTNAERVLQTRFVNSNARAGSRRTSHCSCTDQNLQKQKCLRQVNILRAAFGVQERIANYGMMLACLRPCVPERDVCEHGGAVGFVSSLPGAACAKVKMTFLDTTARVH